MLPAPAHQAAIILKSPPLRKLRAERFDGGTRKMRRPGEEESDLAGKPRAHLIVHQAHQRCLDVKVIR
jgi:hypothetical protein